MLADMHRLGYSDLNPDHTTDRARQGSIRRRMVALDARRIRLCRRGRFGKNVRSPRARAFDDPLRSNRHALFFRLANQKRYIPFRRRISNFHLSSFPITPPRLLPYFADISLGLSCGFGTRTDSRYA